MSNKKNKQKKREFNPYEIDKFAGISPRLKIGFLKFWTVGAMFYVVIFGLPVAFDYFDRLVVYWMVLTLAIEYLSNTVITWMHNDDVDTKKYLPHEISRKKALSLFATAGYTLVMVVLSHFFIDTLVYYNIPMLGSLISETTIDPFTVAFVFLLFDYIWIKVRGTIKAVRSEENERK